MEESLKVILNQGFPGAVIVMLTSVIIFMQRKLDKKEIENTALHRDNNAIQERWRLSESERADRLMETVNTASAVQSALVEKIEIGRGRR